MKWRNVLFFSSLYSNVGATVISAGPEMPHLDRDGAFVFSVLRSCLAFQRENVPYVFPSHPNPSAADTHRGFPTLAEFLSHYEEIFMFHVLLFPTFLPFAPHCHPTRTLVVLLVCLSALIMLLGPRWMPPSFLFLSLLVTR